jgi:hypothetical protein
MDCVSCYFGDKDDLHSSERKRLKEIGLAFRGKDNWPYFRRSRPERMPWFISGADAALLETALEQFIAAYKQYIDDDDLIVDFEEDEVLCRRYMPETGEWTTQAMAMPPIPYNERYYTIENEVLIASLKGKETNDTQLEADTFYFPMPIEAGDGEAPYIARVALLADVNKEIIAAQRLIEPGMEPVEVMIDVLAEYIKANGKPNRLFVRDKWAGRLYGDFCEKTGITLNTEEGVPLLDEFAEEMMERFSSIAQEF